MDFAYDPIVAIYLLLYLVGLLKDTSLSQIKFIDNMHCIAPNEHKQLFFSLSSPHEGYIYLIGNVGMIWLKNPNKGFRVFVIIIIIKQTLEIVFVWRILETIGANRHKFIILLSMKLDMKQLWRKKNVLKTL